MKPFKSTLRMSKTDWWIVFDQLTRCSVLLGSFSLLYNEKGIFDYELCVANNYVRQNTTDSMPWAFNNLSMLTLLQTAGHLVELVDKLQCNTKTQPKHVIPHQQYFSTDSEIPILYAQN